MQKVCTEEVERYEGGMYRGACNEKHSTTETTCLFAPTTTATTQKHSQSRCEAKFSWQEEEVHSHTKHRKQERERERERKPCGGKKLVWAHQVHAQESLHSDWKTVAPRRWRHRPSSPISRLLQAASFPWRSSFHSLRAPVWDWDWDSEESCLHSSGSGLAGMERRSSSCVNAAASSRQTKTYSEYCWASKTLSDRCCWTRKLGVLSLRIHCSYRNKRGATTEKKKKKKKMAIQKNLEQHSCLFPYLQTLALPPPLSSSLLWQSRNRQFFNSSPSKWRVPKAIATATPRKGFFDFTRRCEEREGEREREGAAVVQFLRISSIKLLTSSSNKLSRKQACFHVCLFICWLLLQLSIVQD